MDADDVESEAPVFRSHKRRKTFRRRSDAEHTIHSSATTDESSTLPSEDCDILRPVRPVLRKNGIVFASSRRGETVHESSDDTAMVPCDTEVTEEPQQGDRFVRPTGKVTVSDDKHLVAFVDAKLAEMRSTSPNNQSCTSRDHQQEGAVVSQGLGSLARPAILSSNGNGAPRNGNTSRRSRPPRQAPSRLPTDVARESLVDQIMREAAVPLFSGLPSQQSNDEAGIDNDEAAASAFRADFLASLEENNRRRPPAKPVVEKTKGGMPVPQVNHGPKLGGSRAQRERMKAAEAEAAKGGGVKK